MHQTIQRRLCRYAFLLACVLPTLALAGWVVWRVQPSYQHQQLTQLARTLGVRIACGRIETPRPGVAIYHDLSLHELETDALLAQIDLVHAHAGAEGLRLEGGLLSLESDKLARLAAIATDALRHDQTPSESIRFQRVRLGEKSAWDNVLLTAGDTNGDPKQGRFLEIKQSLAGGVALRLERNRQMTPPTSRLVLDTDKNALPWRLVAGLAPLPADLGPDASFSGRLAYTCESRGGELNGSIANVDLAKLTPDEAALCTAAPAELSALSLHWQAERLTHLDATVVAGQGQVAWYFAAVVRYHLGCGIGDWMRDVLVEADQVRHYPATPLAFDRLAVRVQADSEGIRVTSLPAAEGDGSPTAILSRSDTPLLLAPPAGYTPIEAVLNIVRTPGVGSLYACPRAVGLAQRLPLASDGSTRQ